MTYGIKSSALASKCAIIIITAGANVLYQHSALQTLLSTVLSSRLDEWLRCGVAVQKAPSDGEIIDCCQSATFRLEPLLGCQDF